MTDDLIANARAFVQHPPPNWEAYWQGHVLALADECERQRIYVHELAEQSLALQAMYHDAEQDAADLANAIRKMNDLRSQVEVTPAVIEWLTYLSDALAAHDARIGREGVTQGRAAPNAPTIDA